MSTTYKIMIAEKQVLKSKSFSEDIAIIKDFQNDFG